MAVQPVTVTDVKESANGKLATWASAANGDTGQPLSYVDFGDKTFAVTGTFGVGGSVSLKGSNDGTNYFVLTDHLGNALTFTAAGMKAITENPTYIRPEVTAGDGTTALVATITARRGPR